jgi:DNA-binding transcriptional ArsR family regulator
VQIVEKMGAATLSQIVKATGRSWGAVQWHLYVLEREGRVKSVRIGPFTYYFVNPRAAAEVILASVNPDSLSLEDREKLDLLASGHEESRFASARRLDRLGGPRLSKRRAVCGKRYPSAHL